MHKLQILLLFLLLSFAEAKTVEFMLRTKDGLSAIHGQIDYPENIQGEKIAAVILVSGTGPTERDGFWNGWQRNGADSGLLKPLLAAGYAVVRIDDRGVYCKVPDCQICEHNSAASLLPKLLRSEPINISPIELTEQEIKSYRTRRCILSEERLSVSWENTVDDLATVFDYIASMSEIDTNRLALISHSEGGQRVAKLIAERNKMPATALLLAPVLSSARTSKRKFTPLLLARNYIRALQRYDASKSQPVIPYDLERILSSSLVSSLASSDISLDEKVARIKHELFVWRQQIIKSENTPCGTLPESYGVMIANGKPYGLIGGAQYTDKRDCDMIGLFERLGNYNRMVSIYSMPDDEAILFGEDINELQNISANSQVQLNLHVLPGRNHSLEARQKISFDDHLVNMILNDLAAGMKASEQARQGKVEPFLFINGQSSFQGRDMDGGEIDIKCPNSPKLGPCTVRTNDPWA